MISCNLTREELFEKFKDSKYSKYAEFPIEVKCVFNTMVEWHYVFLVNPIYTGEIGDYNGY